MTTTADEGMPPNQDRRVLRTQAAVLAAGVELHNEGGARAITVEEIARRTGIAKTTIYRHWRSREDLVMAILEHAAVDLPAVHTRDPIGDIRTMLLALWANLALPTSRSGLAGTIEALVTDAHLASQHRDFLTARRVPLVEAVTRAIDAGVIDTDVAAPMLTDLVVSPIIVRALISGDQPDRRYVDGLMAVVLGTPAPKTRGSARRPER